METEGEWKFINHEIQQRTIANPNEYHIGLKKHGDHWEWINGEPLTISKWQVTHGEPSGDGDFAVMSKNYPPGTEGLFNDLPDYLKRAFICEIPRAEGLGNICFENACYTFTKSGKSWKENRNTCERHGGDLVSMETEEEWKFINHEIQHRTIANPNEYHIGLKKHGDHWEWINGKTTDN
ncbi:hypothetical protein OS493_037662 [Desmophyllum pertusum]|uniref:C-type lectin domain-containing protein n=1 Tax=Desmophyllum pertusum TaxID=174260 RepID=A0A9X0D232_9CNID|nr:hypothetical protein OS493_037662 [Desmophyllum pertusum]